MEYHEIEFPNGVLTLPEETIDGTYEEVMDLFWEFLGAIILSSWAYRIKIGDLTLSYSADMLYETNIVSWFEKNKIEKKIELYKGHILEFYDEKDCEQFRWTLEPYFREINVMELKENPDEKFAKYVKRLSALWQVLLRNRDNTLIKMKMLGRAYRMVE